MDALGIYVSVPFCRAKCSFCNFSSGVYGAGKMQGYVEGLVAEMRRVRGFAAGLGAKVPGRVDSIYLGGGTPSLLEPGMVRELFNGIRREFAVDAEAEVTVECAPGQVEDWVLEALLREGVNRLSFGVQSFVDAECTAVGRLHTGAECRRELRRMQAAGVARLGVDLIVGLPHQTRESWKHTVEQALESGVEHVSVYMLEVDEDSRLGREALAGGMRYGAGALPSEDETTEWYELGCEWLEAAGVGHYEISNFARAGGESRHNLKYWRREPYLGFGLDAHSMLRVGVGGVRWANGDEMDGLVSLGARPVDRVGSEEAFEEAMFLGLRLNCGVDLEDLRAEFGGIVDGTVDALRECAEAGLVEFEGARVRLSAAGRMASNEVFERVLVEGIGV